MEAFAIFCGMGIHNTHMYEKAIVAMAKQSVTLEVLSYHASATMDEAHRLRVSFTNELHPRVSSSCQAFYFVCLFVCTAVKFD